MDVEYRVLLVVLMTAACSPSPGDRPIPAAVVPGQPADLNRAMPPALPAPDPPRASELMPPDRDADLPSFAGTRRTDLPDYWLPPSWYCRFGEHQPDPLTMAARDPRWEQRAMDIFSWDSLLAINWPYSYVGPQGQGQKSVDGRRRGPWVAGSSMPRDNAYATLWSTWLTGPELRGWLTTQARAAGPDAGNATSLPRQRAVGWRCEGTCLEDQLSGKGLGPAGATLWDRNGEAVHYEIRVNRSWLDTAARAYATGRKTMSFEYGQCSELFDGDQFSFEGAVELKLAWKVLGKGDIRERFYTMRDVALAGEQRRVDLGLVGLHITHKSKTQSAWIWSSFEHVDNVRANDLSTGLEAGSGNEPSTRGVSTPSFNDPACTSCCANSMPARGQGHGPVATQLTRVNPIDDSTEALNREVRAWLADQGAVWQHYELIGTQYQSRASGEIVPAQVRNTVIEPYLVKRTSCMTRRPPTEVSSCLGCHQDAASKDFSFIPEIFLYSEPGAHGP